ncbi:hypothetical protein CHUAL_013243 [Chamberlinius hualienensis]
MSHLTTELVSHSQRVCRLYKKAVRNMESYHSYRLNLRYHAVLLRARFEAHRDEKDMRKAKQLLYDGEEELFQNMHPQPKKFAYSPGGVAYAREVEPPDWVLDYWHPLEKAQYPDYFAKREQRKEEFIKAWEKKYGKPEPSHH